MYEYDIRNKHTGEITTIWGYNISDAFRRAPELDPKDWEVINQWYID